MKKTMIWLLIVSALLTGCMGRQGLSKKALKWNLQVTEHRWGREGMFILMFPVYVIFGVLDLTIFNSIEFWTEENPINGESSLLALPIDEVNKIFGDEKVDDVQVVRLDPTHAEMHVDFESGDRVTFDVVRTQRDYVVSYRGVEFHSGQIN